MDDESKRPYRKNFATHGLIYLGGEEQEITLLNVSVTGALARLEKPGAELDDVKHIFNTLKASTKCDLFIPKLRIAGEAEIVRVDSAEDHLLLALEFTNIAYNIDSTLYKRKVYRKELSVLGKIVLNNEQHDFHTINVSVQGCMIELAKPIAIEEGLIIQFEFIRPKMQGEARVIWVEMLSEQQTLLGLEYVNMENTQIKGLPRFAE